MLEFFILFTILGFILAFIIKEDKLIIIGIVVISVLWSFAFGPWAIATFFELFIGYKLQRALIQNNKY